jgi:hypothetical protein
MPVYHLVYIPGQRQFLTGSKYRRTPVFLSNRFRRCFVQRLEEVRREIRVPLIGGLAHQGERSPVVFFQSTKPVRGQD